MLADRLQLTVLCQMGPMKILYLDHHSCLPGSLIALYLLRILLTSARPPNFYSSKDVLSSLQQKAEHHGVAPACSPSELPQRIQGRTEGWSKQPRHMGTSRISTWFFCRATSALHVLHTDTLSLRSSPSTDYLLLCKAQNYADWIHCLIRYFLNWGKMPSKKLHSNVSPRSSVSHHWAWGRHKPFGRGRSPLCSRPKAAFSSGHPPCCSTTSAWLHPIKSSQQNLPSSVPDSYEKQQTCWVKCKVSSIFIWLIRTAHQMKTKTWFTAELVQVVVA